MSKNKLKTKISESITNLSKLGTIPAEELQLNLDVLYNSVLGDVCSIVPMNSVRQVISCLKLIYDSKNKSLDLNAKDKFKQLLMNGVGGLPCNDGGFPTSDVNCTIILGSDNIYLASYSKIIPGTISIDNGAIIDENGKLTDEANNDYGTVNYDTGVFTFNNNNVEGMNLQYTFDIHNIMTDRNMVKFVKTFVEVFADMYQLDLDSALVLEDMKSLDIKSNIENILPQVLTQQIDQNILDKYFKQAKTNIVGTWSSDAIWDGNTRVPVSLLYEDLGTFVSIKMSEFANKNGVVPNVILCSPIGYGILSANKNFVPVTDYDSDNTSIPRVVGYYSNAKVILTNTLLDYGDVNIVLTYKGESEAQAAGVYAPFIPVTFRSINGMEASSGLITTSTAYSIAGFVMVNPDLVQGIIINK